MSAEQRRDKIRAIIGKRMPKSAKLSDDTVLYSSGILDSMGIMDLLVELEEAFSISIPGAELQPVDLDTVARIDETVARFGGS